MKTYHIFLLLSFNLLITNLLAQDSTKLKVEKMPQFYKLAIKFSPLSLVDLYNPHIQFGVERMLNKRFSIQQDVAYGFLFSTSEFENQYRNLKISTEGRYYFWFSEKAKKNYHKISHRQSRFFVSVENILIWRKFRVLETLFDNFMVPIGEQTVPINQSIWVINYNVGIQSGLNRRLKFEWYFGIGMRAIRERHKVGNGKLDKESEMGYCGIFCPLVYSRAKNQGNWLNPNFSVGMKLGYVVK